MATIAEDILSNYDEKILIVGLHLRNFLLAELTGIAEQPDLPANMIAYGYGAGYKDTICTIIPSKKGIKLGFYKGSELPDPGKLLAGTGKVHKYVEIKLVSDIYRPSLKMLLHEAVKACHSRQAK